MIVLDLLFSGLQFPIPNSRNFILHFIVAQISKKENVPDLAHSLTVYIFNFTDSSHYDIRLSRDHG